MRARRIILFLDILLELVIGARAAAEPHPDDVVGGSLAMSHISERSRQSILCRPGEVLIGCGG